MRSLLLGLCLTLSLAAGAQEPDVTIDLQRGVGPVTFDLDDKQVHALGPNEEHSYFFHGKAWDATWVWPADPIARMISVLGDPPDERPAFIVVRGYGSKYVLPNGLRLGSSLADVEKLNGRPFALRGFSQDDAGEVLSWRGGRLDQELPGVRLFFHPLENIVDTLDGEDLENVCDGIAMSNSPSWKKLHVEVGAIQIARPGQAKITGPSFSAGEDVEAITPSAAMSEFLQDPERTWSRAYPLTQSPHVLLLETLEDDETHQDLTTLTLLKKTPRGKLECVAQHRLGFDWAPENALTILPKETGKPETGIAIYEPGRVMTAAVWAPEKGTSGDGTFVLVHSANAFPVYKLARNSEGILEVRQVWKDDNEEPKDGPTDYFWDGESFRYSNGARKR